MRVLVYTRQILDNAPVAQWLLQNSQMSQPLCSFLLLLKHSLHELQDVMNVQKDPCFGMLHH